MLSYEDIMNYCSNYKIENGFVFDKNTNQQIIDENIILKVKSSVLLFKESKKSYQSDIQQFGKVSKSQEEYIKKTMEKFSVHNEQSSFGINKLVNAILNANGHYEEFMSGNDLTNSKFSILVPPKSEYGLAYLKLKFREKGLDIEDLKINQDLSELQHNGISKVIIDFKIKKYEKVSQSVQENVIQSNIQHPKGKELNELEKQKQIAKQNNDEVAYNYFQQGIIKIIKENRMQISEKQWASFSNEQKESYIQIKMREAKTLKDKDEFDYWLSTLNNLKQQNSINLNSVSKTSLEGLKNSVGSTEGYTVLVHGTHLTDTEVEKMIFKEGLMATSKNEESSLEHTTQPLDIETYSVEELKSKMDNYGHNNKNMVIIKLPNKYFNMYANYGDRDCTRSRAFMKKIQVDGGYKYVLDPKFIVGSYNTETTEAILNSSFERELTNETRMQLKNNLDNLQKELGIDPDYVEAINSKEIVDGNQTLYNSTTINNEFKDEHNEMVQNIATNKDYNYYFNQMIKAILKYNPNVQVSEEQKKQIIGEIFYNEGYLIKSLNDAEEIRQVMTRSVNELSNNDMQLRLQNIILTEIQEKYKQLYPDVKQVEQKNIQEQTVNINSNNEELDLSGLIEQLKMELNQVQNEYRSMISDGYIDDEELTTLLVMVNKVINNGYALKSLATNPSDLRVISVIINSLEEEQKKMKQKQSRIEEIERIMM